MFVCAEFMFLAQWWSGDCEIAVAVKSAIMMCVQNSRSLLSGGQVTVKLQLQLKVRSRCCVCRIHTPCSVVVK